MDETHLNGDKDISELPTHINLLESDDKDTLHSSTPIQSLAGEPVEEFSSQPLAMITLSSASSCVKEKPSS